LRREVRASGAVLLPCTPASVSVARRHLSDDLVAAGIYRGAICDAVLVVSELLSNAIRHARPRDDSQLLVTWLLDGGVLEVAVSDGGGPTRPRQAHPSVSSLGGRGLGIVEHLATAWGIRDEAGGLTVWAILAAPRPGAEVSPLGTDIPAAAPVSAQQA
jgi:anti-sigma regulatory factor (Ser/Thr protein kinase)